jgi:hypothetical protein
MYWAAARARPNREAVAKHFVELAGYTVYAPHLRGAWGLALGPGLRELAGKPRKSPTTGAAGQDFHRR